MIKSTCAFMIIVVLMSLIIKQAWSLRLPDDFKKIVGKNSVVKVNRQKRDVSDFFDQAAGAAVGVAASFVDIAHQGGALKDSRAYQADLPFSSFSATHDTKIGTGDAMRDDKAVNNDDDDYKKRRKRSAQADFLQQIAALFGCKVAAAQLQNQSQYPPSDSRDYYDRRPYRGQNSENNRDVDNQKYINNNKTGMGMNSNRKKSRYLAKEREKYNNDDSSGMSGEYRSREKYIYNERTGTYRNRDRETERLRYKYDSNENIEMNKNWRQTNTRLDQRRGRDRVRVDMRQTRYNYDDEY